jgi:c-di-GMP-binding flagellar brake protein YcgR
VRLAFKKIMPAVDYTTRLNVGVRGDITLDAGMFKGHYKSVIEDVTEDMVGLAHPFLKGATIPVYRDMNFTFTIEDGSAMYVFEMAVVKADTSAAVPIMWAILTAQPKRIQRRQFLRVPCKWEILLFFIEYEKNNIMRARWMPSVAIDVSLGGYRFIFPDKDSEGLRFELGDMIFGRFTLASRSYFQMGRAVRVVHNDEHGRWEVSVNFDVLPMSVEKTLLEFIRQLELGLRSSDNK